MFLSLDQIFNIIVEYRYLLFFPAAVVEGPIVTIIAGFLVGQDMMNFAIVYVIAVAGDVAGDVLHYAIGRWGRQSLIDKWGKYFGITTARIKSFDKHFKNHSGKTLLLGKLAHGVGGVILAAAGASKVPLKKFIFYNTIGSIPKSLLLILIGFYFGQAFYRINKYLDYFAFSTFALGVLLLLVYMGVLRYGKKIKKKFF
ncbi:MAG: DedA family protein [Patescibacteria group bacterium]|jgi:membrane protein DedA with SNARE-associated domain